MNYQNLLCLGDSQTFGARTYGCYPLYLAKTLSEKTSYTWRCINRSGNGDTARDLWFRLGREIDQIDDTFQSCILIGTNDVAEGSDIELFADYYAQIIETLLIKKHRKIFCGEIPPIHADGHAFFDKSRMDTILQFNDRIKSMVGKYAGTYFVPMPGMIREFYVDPVHFNEAGNMQVASCFAEIILSS